MSEPIDTTETDAIIDQAGELAYDVIRQDKKLIGMMNGFMDVVLQKYAPPQTVPGRRDSEGSPIQVTLTPHVYESLSVLAAYSQTTFWRQVALRVFRIADKKLQEIEKGEE